jgi:hypothetical protein
MRPSADGVVRQEWPPNAHLEGDEPNESECGNYGNVRSSAAPALQSLEVYADRWSEWLTQRAEEAAAAEGDDEAVPVDPLLVESLAALQHAVDKTFVRLERDLAERFAGEAEELRTEIARLKADRADDQERHRAEIRGLRTKLARQANDHAGEIESWRGETLVLQNEVAEVRAIDRLHHSRAGRSHAAAVELKLVRAELERQAKGAA